METTIAPAIHHTKHANDPEFFNLIQFYLLIIEIDKILKNY